LKGIRGSDEVSRWWIEAITPTSIQNNCFILKVGDEFSKAWLEDNYRSDILNALMVAGAPSDLTVKFEVSPQSPGLQPSPPKPESPPEPQKKVRPKAGNVRASSLNPQFTFENFVMGHSNSFAHATALGVSQAPGRAYNPFFIHGQTGLGKTHLMQAVGHQILSQSPDMSVRYVSCETFINKFIGELSKGRPLEEFRKLYRNVDVLLVDDIQLLCGKGSSQQEFFHTFNELQGAHKQIIMTSDLPPNSLKNLEPRLVSRFEEGMVTEIESPDYETRLAILRHKNSLEQEEKQLADDILKFLATHIISNVRSLGGALKRTIAFASLHNNLVLTTDILQDLLKDQLSSERKKELTCEEIQRATVDYYDLRMNDMKSIKRTRMLATPRQVAMFLCRKLTSLSFPEIGHAFDKTHATTVHAYGTIQDRIQVEKDLRESVKRIVQTLGRDFSSIMK